MSICPTCGLADSFDRVRAMGMCRRCGAGMVRLSAKERLDMEAGIVALMHLDASQSALCEFRRSVACSILGVEYTVPV